MAEQRLSDQHLSLNLIGSSMGPGAGVPGCDEQGFRIGGCSDGLDVDGLTVGLDDHFPSIGQVHAPDTVDTAGAEADGVGRRSYGVSDRSEQWGPSR